MLKKGPVLCLGPETETALAQAVQALAASCPALIAAENAKEAVAPLLRADASIRGIDGTVTADALETIDGFMIVCAAGASDWTRQLRSAPGRRDGRIVSSENKVICPARF